MSLAESVSKPSAFLTRVAVFLLRNMPLVQFVFARLASLRGITARGESSEPPLLGEPCGSDLDALDLPSAAPPLFDLAEPDAPDAEMTMADPAVVERAVDDRLGDDLLLSAPPEVDPVVVDARVADITPVDSAFVEQAEDDLPVGDLSLAAPPVVDQPDADAPAADATAADLFVVQRAVHDRMADDASSVDPVAVRHPPSNQIFAEPELDERAEREQLIRRRWMETGIKMWNTNGNGHAALNIQGRAGLLPVRPGEKISRYDTLQFKQLEHGIVCEGVVVEAPRRRK